MDVPRTFAEDTLALVEAACQEGGPILSEEVNRAAVQLARFARGDETAFDELVNEHQQAAFTAAWRILNDQEMAHDTVQEAFLRILRHHEQYDADRPFRSWLLRIVRNLAIDALRRRRRFDHPDRLDGVAAPTTSSAAAMEGLELRERVALVLADLPDKYRDIIVMREMDGLPAETIAAQIGVDYSTTRWRLHQARRLFREAWMDRFGEEP
jgi:RNA polymerase sigma-70 factor (ECF subfamily)